MKNKKGTAFKPVHRGRAETGITRASTLKKKSKAWAIKAGQYLFLALFLGLMGAVLYAAHFLRK